VAERYFWNRASSSRNPPGFRIRNPNQKSPTPLERRDRLARRTRKTWQSVTPTAGGHESGPGKLDGAAADLRKAVELWAKDPALPITSQFQNSPAPALLAKTEYGPKSGVADDEGKRFADKAVAALADVIETASTQLSELKEPDFDAHRTRNDFQKLVKANAAKVQHASPPPRVK
jgi:hypothetical protein